MDFSYSTLLQMPYSVSAYALLIFAFLSCYFVKHIFLRSCVFFLALLFGVYSGRIDYLGIGCILAFGGIMYMGLEAKKPLLRGMCFLLSVGSAFYLLIKGMPGVISWQIAQQALISEHAIRYSMSLNFDTALIGLFFIAFSQHALSQGGHWKPSLIWGGRLGLVAMGLLVPLALYSGYIGWDPKWPSFFWIWFVHNLFFVCLVEEALFRGMIQQFFTLHLQRFRLGKWLALILAAVVFGAAHFQGGMLYVLFATIAGFCYGFAYLKTAKIEAGVLAHLIVNTTHFLCFSYPALASPQ